MNLKIPPQHIILFILITASLVSCNDAPMETASTSTPAPYTKTPIVKTPVPPSTITPEPHTYGFPDSIDPSRQYLFYLHGKIIEDQGIPAISPDYGEYQYQEILETLSGYGFVVISEQRPKNADGMEYASKISEQVTALLEAGVPPKDITVVGASKGAGIAIFASHLLENKAINFVILGICHPDEVVRLKQAGVSLSGNVLSIYDSSDIYAGSCMELFEYSEGKGLSKADEIILEIGSGHDILYQPLEEWIKPTVDWANQNIP
jgi:hypothetical protein